jgi:hypothetical protein
MRAVPCLALLLLATVGFAAQADFAASMPEGVAGVTGWEQVSGDFELPGFRGSYRFYVNPARQALYQVMRFRTATGGARGEPLDPERVAFVPRPGVREPMLCWVRLPAGAATPWRAIAPGSEEYDGEMAMLMRVLAAHRSALAARP